MRKIMRTLGIGIATLSATYLHAQCNAGYNHASLNWDYLDYFSYTGNYTSGNGYLSSNSLARIQRFAFGTQSLKIVHNYSDVNAPGENTVNTAETGAYGTGADVQFIGNGTVTFSFDIAIQNLKFSVFDVDRSQVITITATDGAMPSGVSLSTVSATVITIGGSATAPTATANNTTVSNNNNSGTVNVDIAGPITSFTITATSTGTCNSGCGSGGTEDGSYWISDLTVCSPGNFITNYYAISKPFTGQAGYVLHAMDESVYAVNTTTGFTRFLFKDAAGLGNINSMAYDPYRRILYYVYSLSASPGTNKMLKKFDFTTGIISTVLSDITSMIYGTGVGIPVTSYAGVESGAAAFYDGSLYLGIETSNTNRNSAREEVIWRIDFDAGNVPFRASQVFGLPIDDGSNTLLHDWADFAISNGILYDFDGAGVSTETDIYQMNLMTGAVTNYSKPVNWTPGQIATGWDGKLYQLYAYNTTGTSSDIPFQIALYNGNGTIGAVTNMYSIPSIPFPNPPSLGDAAEAIRFPVDFGDAPASYDAIGPDPGGNEVSANLYLGNSRDSEFVSRGQTSLANSDNYDDGLSTVDVLNPGANAYLTSVKVFNNTGSNAIVCAWLDYNGNGVFDHSEGISVTVASSILTQSVSLFWPSISTSLPMGSYTYLRIRVTSSSNGMTISNPTGYFNNGETEDYRIPVNTYPLGGQLLYFNAEKANNQEVNLLWQVAFEQPGIDYELQRSSNMSNWLPIQRVVANPAGNSNHIYTDTDPLRGISFYRLIMRDPGGAVTYSEVKKMELNDQVSIFLNPNPAFDLVKLRITTTQNTRALVQIADMSGRQVYQQRFGLQRGLNEIQLSLVNKMISGIYSLKIVLDGKTYTEKLVVKK